MKTFGNYSVKRLFSIGCRLVTALLILGFVACSKSNVDEPINGYLVDAVSAGKLTVGEIRSKMTGQFALLQPLVNTGFEMYKVRYKTKYNGEEIIVSGLFIIPMNLSPSVPVMLYTHGTIGSGDPPSLSVASNMSYETTIACVAASVFGCATLLPDYIGYGSSRSIVHPYIHAESLGQTSLDIIRAYIEYSEQSSTMPPANRNLIITGYSEGGYAAVASHKMIQETANYLKIIKTYAGAGPYDVEYFMRTVSELDAELAPVHLSSYLWVLGTYLNCMLNPTPFNMIFSEADNAVLAAANYSLGYLKEYNINLNPKKLFKQSFIDMINNGLSPEFTNIIKQNSLVDFVPSDSLILFHSEADSWVPSGNTVNTFNKMRSKNAPVRKIILPMEQHKDHDDAALVFIETVFLNLLTVF